MNLRTYARYFLTVLLIIAAMPLFLSAVTGCSSIEDLKTGIINRINKSDVEQAAVGTVEEFFNCIIEKDFAKAYSYVYIKNTDTVLQDGKNAIQGSNKGQEKSAGGHSIEEFIDEFTDVTTIINIEAKWIEVKNNIAVVGIDLIDTYDGEEKIYENIEISLVKDTEDNWKINFWN